MFYLNLSMLRTVRAAAIAGGLGASMLASAVGSTPGWAADAAADQPAAGDAAAPAAGDAAAPAAGDAASSGEIKPAKNSSSWVKICEKVPFPDPAAKDPNTAKPIEKTVCATQHESFDPQSGNLLVSVAVREIEGVDKKSLLVGTPLGVVLPAGLALQFDDEKDDKQLVKLRYDFCLPTGCNSESEMPPELLDRIGKSKVMRVLAASLQGATIPFKIGTEDFAASMAGPPVDTAKYLNARKNLVLSLREKMIARQKATQAAAAEAVKGAKEDAAAAAAAGTAAPGDAKTSTGN